MPIQDDLLNPRKRSGAAVPLALAGLVALAVGAFFLGRATSGGPDAEEGATAPVAEAPAPAADPAPPAPPAAPPQIAAAEVPMGEPIPGTPGLRRASVSVAGSLDQSLGAVVGPEVGPPLTQVSTRLLVWWLDISRDVRPGDELDVLYELPAGKEPVVHALRFESGKLGREVRAYRFQPPDAPFARYYDETGREVEERLEDSPIESYEQVTSLLRDGRRHKGVDFKAPVGTPVLAPFDGVVKRKNWNFRGNGNCLEVADGRGRTLLFLHLSDVEHGVGPGTRVKKGQVIARSGNTGRSTAPHLHYQLMAGSRVLDPFEVHKTFRASLPADAKAAFDAARADLDARLAGGAPGVPVAPPGTTAAAAP